MDHSTIYSSLHCVYDGSLISFHPDNYNCSVSSIIIAACRLLMEKEAPNLVFKPAQLVKCLQSSHLERGSIMFDESKNLRRWSEDHGADLRIVASHYRWLFDDHLQRERSYRSGGHAHVKSIEHVLELFTEIGSGDGVATDRRLRATPHQMLSLPPPAPHQVLSLPPPAPIISADISIFMEAVQANADDIEDVQRGPESYGLEDR